MTMREKVAWIAVVTSLVIFGWYFWSVWTDYAAGLLDGDDLFWRFLKCLGLAIAIMLPAALISAKLGGQAFDPPPDELETRIEAISNRVGLAVLEVALVGVVLLSKAITDIARTDFAADPAGATAIMLINLILFVTAAAAVLREILVIVQYRRYA
ncbi:MAG: hypothetical protein KIT02_16675 [Devosia sp.]|uniref:hypothetical protein n=1 Tax=Devosia sp. TaxID=1871048 RepID=UPI0024CBE72D|nr:hypothetical protein [Devosia sp.]UYN99516.1 MAG: hypothetical protein KIT02_16675 [Devosia sp.]